MKRIICAVAALVFLAACSVQENMSPQIFIERLQKNDSRFAVDTDNSFVDGGFVYFVNYDNGLELVFEISTDEQGNSDKISLACIQTDKADEFIVCAEKTVEVYAPDDSADEVIKSLFSGRELNGEYVYYETLWHSYSAVLSENGLYFSALSKKLMPNSEVEFSLKQNDIVEY